MLVIKTNREIELMRKSGEIHFMVMEEIRKNVLPGIRTIDLDRIAEDLIKRHKATPSFKGYKVKGMPGFPASLCISLNNEVIHGIPSKKTILKDGDIVSIDLGVFLNGYHADGARTFAVGNVSDEAKKLINVTEESFYRGIEKAREGSWLRDISANIQEYVESQGFSIVRDFVGHGIGQEMHEDPQIPNYYTNRRGPRLEKGMALAIEPMVNQGTHEVKTFENSWKVVTKDGKLSAHYENTIVITDNEPLNLTKLV